MQFTHETQRLLAGFLLIFGTIALVAAYWSITGPMTLLPRDDNARLVEAEAAIIRGTIYDNGGDPLVESVVGEDGIVSRTYLDPAIYSITGYYSLRYGVGGAEAAYNERLRGDDLPVDLNTYFERDFLHLPQRGSDLQLTIDLDIQQQLHNALGDRFGGAVVISVPEGEVIALVSQPTFNPNNLDANWNQFVEDPAKPFFNRVLQARYQPGGLSYLPLLTAAQPNNIPLTTTYTNATRPIISGGVRLNCLIHPTEDESLTLNEAFVYGCPAPFQELAESLTTQRTDQIFQRTLISNTTTLDDFITEPDDTPETPPPIVDDTTNALGQGSLTVTPMQIVTFTAAILNVGNAPQPHALQAVQEPGSDTWQTVTHVAPTQPLMTDQATQTLRQLMFDAVADGTASAAANDNLRIGGYATRAYTGDEVVSWFTGFVMTDLNTGYAITIVLENTDDFALVAEIGGNILTGLTDD